MEHTAPPNSLADGRCAGLRTILRRAGIMFSPYYTIFPRKVKRGSPLAVDFRKSAAPPTPVFNQNRRFPTFPSADAARPALREHFTMIGYGIP